VHHDLHFSRIKVPIGGGGTQKYFPILRHPPKQFAIKHGGSISLNNSAMVNYINDKWTGNFSPILTFNFMVLYVTESDDKTLSDKNILALFPPMTGREEENPTIKLDCYKCSCGSRPLSPKHSTWSRQIFQTGIGLSCDISIQNTSQFSDPVYPSKAPFDPGLFDSPSGCFTYKIIDMSLSSSGLHKDHEDQLEWK
jgi:hypothetical protein